MRVGLLASARYAPTLRSMTWSVVAPSLAYSGSFISARVGQGCNYTFHLPRAGHLLLDQLVSNILVRVFPVIPHPHVAKLDSQPCHIGRATCLTEQTNPRESAIAHVFVAATHKLLHASIIGSAGVPQKPHNSSRAGVKVTLELAVLASHRSLGRRFRHPVFRLQQQILELRAEFEIFLLARQIIDSG